MSAGRWGAAGAKRSNNMLCTLIAQETWAATRGGFASQARGDSAVTPSGSGRGRWRWWLTSELPSTPGLAEGRCVGQQSIRQGRLRRSAQSAVSDSEEERLFRPRERCPGGRRDERCSRPLNSRNTLASQLAGATLRRGTKMKLSAVRLPPLRDVVNRPHGDASKLARRALGHGVAYRHSNVESAERVEVRTKVREGVPHRG